MSRRTRSSAASAIGRALANLGFTASRRRPSYEEIARAEGAIAKRRGGTAAPDGTPAAGATSDSTAEREIDRALRAHAGAITDVLALLAAAEREGMQAARVEAIRASLLAGKLPLATLERVERRIQEWLAKRAAQRIAGRGQQSV